MKVKISIALFLVAIISCSPKGDNKVTTCLFPYFGVASTFSITLDSTIYLSFENSTSLQDVNKFEYMRTYIKLDTFAPSKLKVMKTGKFPLTQKNVHDFVKLGDIILGGTLKDSFRVERSWYGVFSGGDGNDWMMSYLSNGYRVLLEFPDGFEDYKKIELRPLECPDFFSKSKRVEKRITLH